MTSGKTLFPSSGKGASETGGPLTSRYAQSLDTMGTVNLLSYGPENRSSPRIVTGKMTTEKFTRLKNKIWANPQIRNYEKSNEIKIIRPQIKHKNPGQNI
jgi:hypothetical protein